MCVSFPGRVVAVDEFGAVVETDGRRRRASTLFLPDIEVGEWVAVAAGTIVERLEPDQAAEIEALLRTAIELEDAEVSAASAVPHRSETGAPGSCRSPRSREGGRSHVRPA